ncbi:uncharacterized protein TNCV_2983651 [Trichonephila clavipes]|nr:uncharacterized protein TNCV_2983651 [Trichonephila clavipes]
MTSFNYMSCHSCNGSKEPIFYKTMLDLSRQESPKIISALLLLFLGVPVRSPDLSPIKHIWDHLGWRVVHPRSLNELEARLMQIWNEISQDTIQNLYA